MGRRGILGAKGGLGRGGKDLGGTGRAVEGRGGSLETEVGRGGEGRTREAEGVLRGKDRDAEGTEAPGRQSRNVEGRRGTWV